MAVDKAHKATDKQIKAMEQHIVQIYRDAEKGVTEKAEAYFRQFERLDKQKAKQVEKGLMSKGEYLKWRQNKMLYSKKFENMKQQIAQELAHVNETAIAYINGELPKTYIVNYNSVNNGIQDAVDGYSFELVDKNTVKKIVTEGDKSLLPPPSRKTLARLEKSLAEGKDIRWNVKKVNAEVLQGILLGESMDKIAKRMRNVAEMNATSAIRNARTMVTGAENAGRMDMLKQARADGIQAKKEWIATNDSRTRHWHVDLDGELKDIDEPFENDFGAIMFPGDPTAHPANVYNCRCALGYKVLGFDNRSSEVWQDEELREFTQDEKNALEWYVSGEGMFVNQYLRGTFEGSIYEQDKEAIRNIKSAISKAMVKEKTLYRSIDAGVLFGDISSADFENLRNSYLYGAETPQEKKIVEKVEGMIGKQVQENGFMSTSRDRDLVFDWDGFTGSDKDIPMQLNIPKNIHGADLSFLDVEGDEQKEVLLEDGLYYEFLGFEVQRDQYGGKKLVALVNIIKKRR